MLQSKLIGETYKEWPKDATLKSHGLLLKGGYIRQMASGIYTLLPIAKKVVTKIENIIREEMNNIGSQEMLMPLVATRKLWDMSGRYDTINGELLKFKDRTGTDMLLSMTHEEAVTFVAMTEAKNYLKYPFSVYQLQTKFRDEARSRGGLIRVREFTMKDAYSFHRTEESLNETYNEYYEAYNKIYARVGVPEVIAVASDTGMMGGTGAHEYMLLCEAGEDKIVVCNSCNYSANMEVATCNNIAQVTTQEEKINKILTPNVKSIEKLVDFTGKNENEILKAVVYTRMDTKAPLVIFLRADREVNEAKVRNYIKSEIEPRKENENDGLVYGYIGPVGLVEKEITVIYDISIKNEKNLICGANEINNHYTGLSVLRDLPNIEFIDVSKIKETDICHICGKKSISISNGIEVGNIFKLGTKYTSSMGMTYTEEDGKNVSPIMGCYGIGVGRLMASVLEARATENKVNWPASIAPFDIHICPIDYQKEENIKKITDEIYNKLKLLGFDVLLDDRQKSAGVKFADADLIGAPIRLVISPRNIANETIEIKIQENEANLINIDKIYEYINEERCKLK